MKPTRIVAALGLAAMLAACAPEVVRNPTELGTLPAPRAFRTAGPASIPLPNGSSVRIAAGTELAEVGRVPQGRVLKPTNTVIAAEGAHVHEAYVVVEGNRLVGFFLPFERAFAPASAPVDFPLEERPR